MENKGTFRLFGFINPLDILLLAGVVALIGGAYIFSAPQEAAASDRDQKISYTIELIERKEGFHKKILPGATVYDTERGYAIGTVTGAYALPYWADSPDEENEIYRRAYIKGMEFTYVTVEAYAQISDYETLIGQYSIMVNKQVYVRSRDFAGQGFISAMDFGGGGR